MILITADGGGSNGSRLRLWKLELQKFADQTGLCISVCHFPPGTSKWNKIEHRLFSFITSNWHGEPLRDYETIVKPHRQNTTAKGLKVTVGGYRRKYPTGRKVSDEEMKNINEERNKFHGDWNYVIRSKTMVKKLIPLFIYGSLPWNPTRLGAKKRSYSAHWSKREEVWIYNARYKDSVEDKVHRLYPIA